MYSLLNLFPLWTWLLKAYWDRHKRIIDVHVLAITAYPDYNKKGSTSRIILDLRFIRLVSSSSPSHQLAFGSITVAFSRLYRLNVNAWGTVFVSCQTEGKTKLRGWLSRSSLPDFQTRKLLDFLHCKVWRNVWCKTSFSALCKLSREKTDLAQQTTKQKTWSRRGAGLNNEAYKLAPRDRWTS